MPFKPTPRQPTPCPSGTQWLEDLSHEPSQHDEPPIPGPSPSSKPPEDVPTCEPKRDGAPTQSTKEALGKSPLLFLYSYHIFLTPPLIISSLSCYSPLCNHHQQYAHWIPPPCSPSPCVTPPSTPTPVPSQCPQEPHRLLLSFP
ncbi:hypothetical protein O181_071288 [Austropuccinia psidii MF-1]|uniref:Uncharacterized protein n=1 Tax=Austropuccinia psidii MF-1 TaxID=1389203 RepID=A0A9Q3F0R5_9BASI|nr:hypothetical protein [Austropuccinia psidii MF-1]